VGPCGILVRLGGRRRAECTCSCWNSWGCGRSAACVGARCRVWRCRDLARARAGQRVRVCITDVPQALPLLELNAARNMPSHVADGGFPATVGAANESGETDAASSGPPAGNVEVRCLRWGNDGDIEAVKATFSPRSSGWVRPSILPQPLRPCADNARTARAETRSLPHRAARPQASQGFGATKVCRAARLTLGGRGAARV
jgi:hypothetical protein